MVHLVSFAWVPGPPLATAIIGWYGSRAILAALAVIAPLNVATTNRVRRRMKPVDVAAATSRQKITNEDSCNLRRPRARY